MHKPSFKVAEWEQEATASGVAHLLSLLLTWGLLLVLTGPLAKSIGDIVGLGSTAVTAWDIAKWPVLILVVSFMIALLYYASPNVRHPKFQWVSPGSILAVLLLLRLKK